MDHMDKPTMDNSTNCQNKDLGPSMVKIELIRICANKNCTDCKSLKHYYHNMVAHSSQHHSNHNQRIHAETSQHQITKFPTKTNESPESPESPVPNESKKPRKSIEPRKSHSL